MEEHNTSILINIYQPIKSPIPMPANIYFFAKSIRLSKFTNIFSKKIIDNIRSNNIIKELYIKKKSAKLLVNNFIIDC